MHFQICLNTWDVLPCHMVEYVYILRYNCATGKSWKNWMKAHLNFINRPVYPKSLWLLSAKFVPAGKKCYWKPYEWTHELYWHYRSAYIPRSVFQRPGGERPHKRSVRLSVRRLVLLFPADEHVNVRLDGWRGQSEDVVEVTIGYLWAEAGLRVLHLREVLVHNIRVPTASGQTGLQWARGYQGSV